MRQGGGGNLACAGGWVLGARRRGTDLMKSNGNKREREREWRRETDVADRSLFMLACFLYYTTADR